MQAVILVAGRGTRMGDLTENTPKPMLKIKDKPILEHKLKGLPKEIDEVILIVGYKKEIIKDYFGDTYGNIRIRYIEQFELDGTAGAIKLAEKYVHDRFLVLMGDDLYAQDDLNRLMKYNFALLTYKTKQAQQFGLIEVDSNGNLLDVIERPHNKEEGLVNIGAYTISKSYFKYEMVKISETEYGLPQTLASASKKHNVKILETNKWQPIGSPSDLVEAERNIKTFL